MSKRVKVALIGGGLAGLVAARLLRKAGLGILLIEARDRLGGRIRTTDEPGRPSADGFDPGASWVWPEAQPGVAALAQELGLALMPQYGEGDVVFHRMSREAPQRFRRAGDAPRDPSMRVVWGAHRFTVESTDRHGETSTRSYPFEIVGELPNPHWPWMPGTFDEAAN